MKKKRKTPGQTASSMEDPTHHPAEQHLSTADIGSHHERLSGWSLFCTSVTGLITGGPLLGMSGFSFLASLTLFLISSPLLLIFSPLIFGAAFVFTGAVSSFGVAALMGLAGMALTGCTVRSVLFRRIQEDDDDHSDDGVVEVLKEEISEDVKEDGEECGGDLQKKMEEDNQPAA